MGWTYPHGCSRKSLIAELTSEFTWVRENDSDKVTHKCLRHCFRGSPWAGVLWAVWERTIGNSSYTRYITCHLLRYHTGEWGYKDMDESVHPYYYGCPLSYLNLAPVASAEWRANVRRYWEQKKVRAT